MVLELILAFIVELVLLQFFQRFFRPSWVFSPWGMYMGRILLNSLLCWPLAPFVWFLVILYQCDLYYAPLSSVAVVITRTTNRSHNETINRGNKIATSSKLVCSISAECSPGINSIHYFKHALQHYYILKRVLFVVCMYHSPHKCPFLFSFKIHFLLTGALYLFHSKI